MQTLKSVTTGEMFLARKVTSGYELSGPQHYRDVARAVESEFAGETYDFDGDLVDAIPAGLRAMGEDEIQRVMDESTVQGVKVGHGWL